MDTIPSPRAVLQYHSPQTGRRVHPSGTGVLLRIAWIFATVLPPIFGLQLAASGAPGSVTNEGHGVLRDQVAMLMSPLVAWPFYLLAAFGAAGMILLVIGRYTPRRLAVARTAILVGLLINIQYCLVAANDLWFDEGSGGPLLPLFAVLVACLAAAWQIWPGDRPPTLARAIGGAGVLLFSLFACFLIGDTGPSSAWLFAAVFTAAPGLPLLAYASAWKATMLLPNDHLGASSQAGAGAYVAALAYAVVVGQINHDALFAVRRGLCYVATAAARGHRRFVGARVIQVEAHDVLVNDQLCYLICGELALRYTHPRLARAVRRTYDRVGPGLARHINGPVRGDLAYMIIKPLEYLARVYVQRACPALDPLQIGYSAAP